MPTGVHEYKMSDSKSIVFILSEVCPHVFVLLGLSLILEYIELYFPGGDHFQLAIVRCFLFFGDGTHVKNCKIKLMSKTN